MVSPGQEVANGQMWAKGAKVQLHQRSEFRRPGHSAVTVVRVLSVTGA